MSRTLAEKLDPANGPKRILALDGGGVKGILTLGMLEVLETELRRRANNPNLLLCDYFDLIGGTSTGAIIAAGLAVGKSVGELIEMYGELGPKVFGKPSGDGLIMGAKYDARALHSALWPVLDKKTLGSTQIRTGLALHAKRIDTGSAWVLTNNPNAPYYDPPDRGKDTVPNKDYRLIDIVKASAAAPTFFDEQKVTIAYDESEKPTEEGYFVDGAVGGFNNPGVQLLLTVLIPAYGFNWPSGADNLMMASFGTGARRPSRDGRKFASQAPAAKGIDALRSMIWDTQVQAVMLLQALSEPQKPWRINSEIGDMGGRCALPSPVLDYQRVDVELVRKDPPRWRKKSPRTAIETLLDRELDHRVLESVDQLANGRPENMKLLLEIGRKAAPAYVDAHWPHPRFDLPQWSS